ncbi:MAG: hypothetical protein ACRCZD_13190 [Phycicoccus sp.]
MSNSAAVIKGSDRRYANDPNGTTEVEIAYDTAAAKLATAYDELADVVRPNIQDWKNSESGKTAVDVFNNVAVSITELGDQGVALKRVTQDNNIRFMETERGNVVDLASGGR